MKKYRVVYGFRTAQLYFKLFLFFIVPLFICYAIYSRTLEDFVLYAGGISVVLSLVAHAWLPSAHFRYAIEHDIPFRIPPFKKLAIFSAFISVFSIPLGVLYYSLAVVLVDAWMNIRNWQILLADRPVALAIGTIAVITAGMFFFWFRLRTRFIYGVSETLAGIAFAVHRLALEPDISRPSDEGFYFAVLTAGVYLIVRGLDNMHQAWKDQNDPLAKVLFQLGTQSDLVAEAPRRLRSSRMVKKVRRRSSLPT